MLACTTIHASKSGSLRRSHDYREGNEGMTALPVEDDCEALVPMSPSTVMLPGVVFRGGGAPGSLGRLTTRPLRPLRGAVACSSPVTQREQRGSFGLSANNQKVWVRGRLQMMQTRQLRCHVRSMAVMTVSKMGFAQRAHRSAMRPA